jgi:hypothetical protein
MKMKRKMISYFFFIFPSNGAPVEWNWQGKTEVLGEKPVPVSFCPPQILQGLTRDRTRASMVGARRLTASALARPQRRLYFILFYYFSLMITKISVIEVVCCVTLRRISVTDLDMSCGFNLIRLFVINLILIFLFFMVLLPLSNNCAVSVYLCIVAFECSFSNCPCVAKRAC